MKLSVCAETFYKDLQFHEKIKNIAALGYPAVEFWFWDDSKGSPKDLAALLKSTGISVSAFVATTGGAINNPADRKKCLENFSKSFDIAQEIGCRTLITITGNVIEGLSTADQLKSVEDTLGKAAITAEKKGITIVLEMLNTAVDHKGYLVDTSRSGFDIVRNVASPGLKVLYDIYHMQIMEGNIIATIEKNIGMIGHFHAAGVPGRHELGPGELDYRAISRKIDGMKYDGYFGLEYFPLKDTEASLKETKKMLA